MMPARILVVNSPASDYLLIKSLLSDYSVLSAYGKAETLRQLDMCGDIDLLILDMSSDDKDGCEILNAINPNPRYNHLRSIVITNFDDGEAETTVYALSAADYLCKPIHRESFKSCIKMNLELTHQERFKHELNELKVLFDAIFQRVPVGIAICYNDNSHAGSTETISINPMLEKITGRTRDEIMKLGWQAITHPDDLEKDLSYFRRLQSGEIESYSMEKRYLRPDGSSVWVHMVVASLSLPNMSKNNHICIVQDISERKEIERALSESERSKSVLLSHLPGLAYRCLYDREWTMLYVSSGCIELTGYRPESLLYNTELSYNDLITPEYREPLYNEWERILSARLPFKYEYQITTATGERKWVLEMGQGIYDEEGNVEALEGIVLDISDRKKMEDNLRYQYEHDRWTGLYNRSYLENLLISEAKTPKAGKRAVISINLSAVQSLTTTYGFHYTQDLIKSISDALFIHCTDKRMLFNTYENRFVFYVRDYKVRAELTNFCESIIKTLNPMLTAERVGAGLGIIEIDDYRQLEVDELLRNLLIASEKALSMFNGEIGYLFFDESMEAQIMRENEIKRTLTHIAESDDDCGLFLQYQPILDLKTNRICGFELWQD
jgi:PAS domain S-box-containing protein